MPLRQLEMQHAAYMLVMGAPPQTLPDMEERQHPPFPRARDKKTSTNNSNNYPKSSLQIDDGHDTMDNKYNESSSYGESSSTSIQQQYNTHPITAQDVVSNKSILSNSFGNRVSSFRLAILFMV
jgi:hypothetical protein